MYGKVLKESHLRREENVGSDATGADLVGQGIVVDVGVLAGSANVTAVVGAGVASEAVLPLQVGGPVAVGRVTDEHAETRSKGGNLAGGGGDVVYEDTAIGLGGKLVTELETKDVLAINLTLLWKPHFRRVKNAVSWEFEVTYGLPNWGTRLKVPFLALK